MRSAVVDWILIAGVLGAFLGGLFTPPETREVIVKYITLDGNVTDVRPD